MAKKPTTIQRRNEAEAKVQTLKLQAEAAALEKTLSLLESPQPVRVPWHEYPAYDTWGMGTLDRPYIWTSPDDRTERRYRPLYENAEEHRRIRAESRALVELFPVARGALQKLSDYVFGTGWDFVVQPKKVYKNDPTAIQVARTVQRVVDRFLEYNQFVGNLDREMHEESRIDGDVYPTLYVEDNHVRAELTDPGCVLEPANKQPLQRMIGTDHLLNGWWHGVHTVFNRRLKRDDVARPLGFHAVFDNTGDQWDYLPSSRVEHIKRNVGRLARVGVSDFLTVRNDLESEAKLRRNTAIGAAISAAIIGFRQHAEGATRSTVENFHSANATYSYQKQTEGGSRTQYGEQVPPGTIKDISAGMQWVPGALGVLNSPVYIEVAQYLLRIIGSPWSMPEYLISGDASNANYASTLVSESPFVKYCEHEQAFYASHNERLIWKALRMYYELGAFGSFGWSQICNYLEVNAEYSSPASRDKKQQIEVDKELNTMGVKSKRSIAADHEIDFDEEQEHIGREPKPAPSPAPLMMPGRPMEARESALALRAMERLLESAG